MQAGRRHGFTLIEVLVAIGIVGFGLLSLLTLLPVGLRSTRLAGDFTNAAFLGRQALDQIRARAQISDFIDDNLDVTADTTDGNGRQDSGEPTESGFFLEEAAPAGTITWTQTPPPGVLQADTVRDNDALGYFDLPHTVKKGAIRNFRVLDPLAVTPQTYTIRFLSPPSGAGVEFVTAGATLTEDFIVIGHDADGSLRVLEGNYDVPFPLAGDTRGDTLNIEFTIVTNTAAAFDQGADGLDNDGDGDPAAASCAADLLCDEADEGVNDEFLVGETIEVTVATIENAWYAYWASRYDVSEDRELPEFGVDVDGVLTDLDTVAAGVQTVEDTGLDMVPNFFDKNYDSVQNFDEGAGETGYSAASLQDPHGDDGVARDNDVDTLFNEDPVDGRDNDYDGLIDEDPAEWDPVTGAGTENDGILNALPENEIQRVTVTVVWREGGVSREARFSTMIANPYL